jgi:hypothetical protein
MRLLDESVLAESGEYLGDQKVDNWPAVQQLECVASKAICVLHGNPLWFAIPGTVANGM